MVTFPVVCPACRKGRVFGPADATRGSSRTAGAPCTSRGRCRGRRWFAAGWSARPCSYPRSPSCPAPIGGLVRRSIGPSGTIVNSPGGARRGGAGPHDPGAASVATGLPGYGRCHHHIGEPSFPRLAAIVRLPRAMSPAFAPWRPSWRDPDGVAGLRRDEVISKTE